MITITSMRHGLAIDCDCVVQDGIRLTPERCSDACYVSIGYLKGKKEPHFPMPAIQYEAFIYPDRVTVWMGDERVFDTD